MLSFASTLISYECIIKTAEPILMAIKKRTSWEITHVLFYYSNFCFVESWKLFTTVATSPYHVFAPSKVSMVKLMLDLDCCAETDLLSVTNLSRSLCKKIKKICKFTCVILRYVRNF